MAQTVSFTDPYQMDAERIKRQQALAMQLQQQAEVPLEAGNMVSGHYVPTSPLAHLAKALKGVNARSQFEKSEKDLLDIDRRRSDDFNSDRRALLAAQLGRPADPGVDDPTAGYSAPSPAQAPNPRAMNELDFRSPQFRQLQMQRMMPKDPMEMLGKLDPKDYTAESFGQFLQSGNPGILRPRVKHEQVNRGGTTAFIDPYAPPPEMSNTMKPGESARLGWDQYQFGNLSANQRAGLGMEAGRLANQGIEARFNTGQGVGGPVSGGLPQNAPMPNFGGMAPTQNLGAPMPQQAPAMPPRQPIQPPTPPQRQPIAVPSPAPQDVVPTPKSQQQILVDLAKQQGEMDQKRAFNMGGINEALDTAEGILKGRGGPKPTQSVAGSVLDSAGRVIGKSPEGAAQADQLKAIGGALVAKVPRMEGPQSDKDVMLYREMAGNIGNDTLPIARRLEALKTVRQLYAKYERLNTPAKPDAGNDPLGLR